MSRLSGGAAADGDAAATLEGALRVAFGPAGKGVMLKEGTTGILTVTRSSREIARATFDGVVPMPWLLPVLSAAESLEKRAGDGGKGVLLGALAVSRLDLSPKIVRDVLNMTDDLAHLAAPIGKSPPNKIEPIIDTFLRTRLTPVVRNAVLPSICDWLTQDLEFASKHTRALCRVEEASGPVTDTVCNEGVTIQGCTENMPCVPRKMRLRVILEGAVPTNELDGTVVASKRCLEEKVVSRLVSSGAAVLHGLSEVEAQLISEADCTEVEVKCVRGGVWLAMPGVRQLVVYAPMVTLGREISRTAQDALRLWCYSDSRLVRIGALERSVLRRLIENRRGKPPPLGRKFLLALTSTKDDTLADNVAAAIMDMVTSSPELATILGVVVSTLVPRTSDAEGLEPVTLRLAVLSGALSAGARCKFASAPLPARRLHS